MVAVKQILLYMYVINIDVCYCGNLIFLTLASYLGFRKR